MDLNTPLRGQESRQKQVGIRSSGTFGKKYDRCTAIHVPLLFGNRSKG